MATLEKVTCFPSRGTPEVIPGDPVAGDLVRITNGSSVAYQHYTPQPLPPVPSQTEGRDLTWGEFLAVGAKVSLLKFNAVLANFPIAVEIGRQHQNTSGIKFSDVGVQDTMLGDLVGGAKQAGLIDEEDEASLVSKWIEMFPKMESAE